MKVILGKSVKFRDGIESDATSLALFFDSAGRRIPPFSGVYMRMKASLSLNLDVKIFVPMMKRNHIIKTGK